MSHDAPVRDVSPADHAARMLMIVERLKFARRATQNFLADLTPDQWYWSPPQYPTHIAWQVMHVAVAQYSLCFRRIRGQLPEDDAWCPADYLAQFGVGSAPRSDDDGRLSVDEIQRVFDGVFERAVEAVPKYSAAQLAEPVDPPHPVFKTNLEAIEMAPHHEAIHAGQIAMLRRLMGKKPLR